MTRFTARLVTAGLALLTCGAAFGAPQFQEATTEWGVDHVGASFGASVGDYNGDGYPDIWVGNHSRLPNLYVSSNGSGFSEGIGNVASLQNRDNHGAAWADFDRDGDQDLLELVGGSNANRLFVQFLNGSLNDKAAEHLIGFDGARGRTPLWFDYDNDGLLDIFLANILGDQLFPNVVHNNGQGFDDVTASVGVIPISVKHAQLADLSGDMRPEIVLSKAGAYPGPIYDTTSTPFTDLRSSLGIPLLPGALQTTDAVFADFTGNLASDFISLREASNMGLVTPSSTQVSFSMNAAGDDKTVHFVSAGDITLDAASVGATPLTNLIFVGVGNPPLDEVPVSIAASDPQNWGIDNYQPGVSDGLFIGYDPALERWTFSLSASPSSSTRVNAAVETSSNIDNIVTEGFSATPPPVSPYYLVAGQGGFTEESATRGLAIDADCESAVAGDFDNDADQDVYLACASAVANLPNILLENDGTGNFSVVAGAGGATGSITGRSDSVVTADFDRDGCLDLFVTNGEGGEPFHDGPHQLFLCVPQGGNHWIEIRLAGRFSNVDGIGTTVIVTTAGLQQTRLQNGGIHRFSQNDTVLHFGLAQHTSVDTLDIYWPSGIHQTLSGVAADQVLTITETGTTACSDGIDNDSDNRIDYPDDPSCESIDDTSEAPPADDDDDDGVLNSADNCQLTGNPDQRDTDADGLGNLCDADLSNDCIVNTVDLGIFRSRIFSNDPDADFNGDGIVNVIDLAVMKSRFFAPPGPSGLIDLCD